jgi:hypothetical protein
MRGGGRSEQLERQRRKQGTIFVTGRFRNATRRPSARCPVVTIPNRTIDIITSELRLALRRGTADILDIGRLLVEAKEKMPHGEWLPWLKGEVSLSERSAQKYIKAADYAAKYELGADLNLSPSALFLISRYDQREIADAIVAAAKEKHLGCDQAKEIIDKTLAERDIANQAQSEESLTGSAPQHDRPRSGVNPDDYLLRRFTAVALEMHKVTKGRQATRFAKCAVEVDKLADLGQLLTEISSLKAPHAALEANADPAALHERV